MNVDDGVRCPSGINSSSGCPSLGRGWEGRPPPPCSYGGSKAAACSVVVVESVGCPEWVDGKGDGTHHGRTQRELELNEGGEGGGGRGVSEE
jgi:hypothetical protein